MATTKNDFNWVITWKLLFSGGGGWLHQGKLWWADGWLHQGKFMDIKWVKIPRLASSSSGCYIFEENEVVLCMSL